MGKDEEPTRIYLLMGCPCWPEIYDLFKVVVNDSLGIQLEVVDFQGTPSEWPSLMVETFKSKIQQRPNERRILISHSVSGFVCARLCEALPDAFAGVVFLAPGLMKPREKPDPFLWLSSTLVLGCALGKAVGIVMEYLKHGLLGLEKPRYNPPTIFSILARGELWRAWRFAIVERWARANLHTIEHFGDAYTFERPDLAGGSQVLIPKTALLYVPTFGGPDRWLNQEVIDAWPVESVRKIDAHHDFVRTIHHCQTVAAQLDQDFGLRKPGSRL
eukprot:TRINITY_DN103107_c0_g1_i1.p1 TRINITY_DN103107_c0_g1~~TRINITY_DN103107_c0_g1_i1.p1  ORF type:complete len:284 (+),score=39.40 TRINITY_DN103107_c0_g1_i1:35-853(+)